jgi:CO/xanthine dehydrogenase FAD-binding subunit
MDVLQPRTLEQALELRAERPDALAIRGGTDVMVDLNFDRVRPPAVLDLSNVEELGAWSRENGTLRIGAGVTYTQLAEGVLADELPALAEASRTVGSPQIRNRGTIGGNLGTASPAGDALPPLLVLDAEVELASARGTRRMAASDFLTGPKRTALGEDELITAVHVQRTDAAQTFLKVGPRNAMVIAVCSLAVAVDSELGEVRASFGSAGPVPGLVRLPLSEAGVLSEAVMAACSPIDDVRGTAAYRRHALGVLARRGLERCLVT